MRFRILRHGVVDSTSERAFAALAGGSARHGDVHVARGQSSGRGRLGRAWASATDEGLYLSVVLLPGPPPLSPPALTMGAGLAVLDAVRTLGLDDVRLDWPNDLLAGDAKLCGILVESRGLDPAAPHYVVGIGLNVRQATFPEELTRERPVTSLLLRGVDRPVQAALDALLESLAPTLERVRRDPDGIARDYLAATGLRGRGVEVETAAGVDEGELVDLDLGAGVTLLTPDGRRVSRRLEHVRAVRDRSG